MSEDDPPETTGDDYVDLRDLNEGTSSTPSDPWPAGSSLTSFEPPLAGVGALCALLLVAIGLANTALALFDVYLVITPSWTAAIVSTLAGVGLAIAVALRADRRSP